MGTDDAGRPTDGVNDPETVVGAASEGGTDPVSGGVSGGQTVLGPASSTAPFPFERGERVGPRGRWGLLQPLGQGGWGQVWKAQDFELDGVCALKFVPMTSNPALDQFLNEAAQARRVVSRQVVRVHELIRLQARDGSLWGVLCQEYVDGEGLERIFASARPDGAVNARELEVILRAALSGLQSLHEARLVHRDIKPSNLLIRGWAEGQRNFADVVIVDLGTCASIGGDLRLSYSSVGSPGYMPPEAHGDAWDARPSSDLYSLGVVAIEAWSGRPPSAWTAGERADPALLLQDLPERLVRGIVAAIGAGGHPRFRAAQEWLDTLEASGGTDAAGRPRRSGLSTGARWAIGLGLLAIAGVVAVAVIGPDSADTAAESSPVVRSQAEPPARGPTPTPASAVREQPTPAPAPPVAGVWDYSLACVGSIATGADESRCTVKNKVGGVSVPVATFTGELDYDANRTADMDGDGLDEFVIFGQPAVVGQTGMGEAVVVHPTSTDSYVVIRAETGYSQPDWASEDGRWFFRMGSTANKVTWVLDSGRLRSISATQRRATGSRSATTPASLREGWMYAYGYCRPVGFDIMASTIEFRSPELGTASVVQVVESGGSRSFETNLDEGFRWFSMWPDPGDEDNWSYGFGGTQSASLEEDCKVTKWPR